jgi:hypothetical protein
LEIWRPITHLQKPALGDLTTPPANEAVNMRAFYHVRNWRFVQILFAKHAFDQARSRFTGRFAR